MEGRGGGRGRTTPGGGTEEVMLGGEGGQRGGQLPGGGNRNHNISSGITEMTEKYNLVRHFVQGFRGYVFAVRFRSKLC